MSKLPVPGSVPGFASGGSRALSSEAENLEKQLILRRQRLRSAAHEFNRKFSAKMTSPGVLLSAVGVGVALEQANHHRGWSILGLLNTTNSCIQLLRSLAPVAPSAVNGFTDNAE
ncbi:MAG: hypothetical protein SH820_10965 [Xanthomonadales bacterium]|nr:hypothetical protein [Xanthomonadales bacterium]